MTKDKEEANHAYFHIIEFHDRRSDELLQGPTSRKPSTFFQVFSDETRIDQTYIFQICVTDL
jgi:hypothetical protein